MSDQENLQIPLDMETAARVSTGTGGMCVVPFLTVGVLVEERRYAIRWNLSR